VELGYLVQFIVRGQVLSTSGVQRPVYFSFVYRSSLAPLLVADKPAYGSKFDSFTWQAIGQMLNVSWVGISTDVLYPNSPGDTALSVLVPANGGRPGGRLPLNTCVFVAGRTASRGRRYFGSKRMCPVTASDTDGDELNAPGHGAWTGAMASYTAPMNVPLSGGRNDFMRPVVWSRAASVFDMTIPPAIGDDLVVLNVNRTLSTWRHRKERVIR
jgi:hypothetical protein